MWMPSILRPRVKASPVTQFHRAYFYPVGAMNSVYEPAPPIHPAMLPMFVNFSGNGVLYAHAPNPIFGPQLVALQANYVSGVGGPLAGQIVGQGLTIPETTNGSQ
jgi:hypothetical protein